MEQDKPIVEQTPNDDKKDGVKIEGQPIEPKQDKEPKKENKEENKSEFKDDEAFTNLINSYEEKIKKLNEEHQTELKKRDTIIRQLVVEDKKETKEETSIADKINSERNFKKW